MALTKVKSSMLSTSIEDNGNATAITIDSSENVGIGTTAMYGRTNSIPKAAYNASGTNWAESAYTAAGSWGGGYSLIDGSAGYLLAAESAGTNFVIRQGTVGSTPTERMRIDGSGNVGIGTSSPEATLHIADIGSTGPALHIAGGSATEGDITTPHNESLQIGHWNESTDTFTERMRINTSGHVGIGTTSPSYALSVKGLGSSTVPASFESSGSSSWLMLKDSGTTLGNVRVGSSSDALVQYAGGAERMRIDSSGRVGIGTSSPEYNLDVTADDNVTTTTALSVQNASRNYGLGLGAYTLTNRNIGGSAATVDYTFDIGRHAIFKTNNTERMRILSSGTLLVGKSSSATNLTGLEAHGSGSVFSSISTGNTYHVKNTTNNVFTFYVGYTGGVINYQSLNVNLSDEREKKNIEPLESKWDSVKSWSLKTFHYNHQADESIKNYGVIAQDVEQTNPEAIDVYQKDEDTERKGVKEQQMMWMAIKALQEAQTRIETLETRIAALEE
jgi:hypothetical protein